MDLQIKKRIFSLQNMTTYVVVLAFLFPSFTDGQLPNCCHHNHAKAACCGISKARSHEIRLTKTGCCSRNAGPSAKTANIEATLNTSAQSERRCPSHNTPVTSEVTRIIPWANPEFILHLPPQESPSHVRVYVLKVAFLI